MSATVVTLHNHLPKAWCPTRSRIRRIEKCLVTHGSCLSFSSHSGSGAGISKTKERAPRVVFKKRKITARLLLFVWETARTDAVSVKATCGNSWCVVPLHQQCKT